MSITQVLTNPNAFFAEKTRTEVEMKTPILIILVIAVLGAINAAIMTQKIMEILPPEAAAFAGIGAIAGAIGAFISSFIMWIIYSGVFYAISSILGGEGTFKRVLEVIAYGFIPSIASGIIGIIVMVTSFSVENFDMQNPELLEQAIVNDPTMRMSVLIGIIFTLWSANIWIFGLVHARNMSVKNAAISVLVPVGLYILYTARHFIGA
ncbi:YIP1 family protein [Methanococcoides methylutens]|uniref:Yip1 domain protein n=1 Tax=Methanococcoides methylutens MM1 TaxID=1434104 RepID=A0A0E3WZF2_METMT|nr:YIP1 family protein [Methanococcoides methylutens]AKB84254.1 Yip1 domain protein [Methanococcoides methylutens MM1]